LDAASLRAAQTAGIVTITGDGRVRFAHPLFASAIYDSATPAERRRVHTKLADESHDAEETARHRALASDGPDEQVAELLDRAAHVARHRGAPDVAAELAERASELTPPDRPAARWERGVTAAEHHFHAGDLVHARELLDALMDDAAPQRAVSRGWRLLGETYDRLGLVDQGLEHLRRAVDCAQGDPASSAQAELSFAIALLYSSHKYEDAAAAAHQAVTFAEMSAVDRASLACSLAVSVAADLLSGQPVDPARLERALALEDPDQPLLAELRPSFAAGFVWTHQERFDQARAQYDRLAARLVDRGEDSDLPSVLAHAAWMECLSGNLSRAADLADRGYEYARQSASDSLASLTRGARAYAYAHEGCVDETRAAATEAIDLANRSGWRVGESFARYALGLLEISLGNDQAVLDTLTKHLAAVERVGVVDPFHRRFLPDAIEAMIHLGQLQRADDLTEQYDQRARTLDRPAAIVAAARCRALIDAARGDVGTALDHLERVLNETPSVPVPLDLARTLIVKGQLERRAKHKRESRASLEAALQICDDIGAALWSQRARAELDRLGPLAQAGELTTTEARIARLVASGSTNRDVAIAAFVSVKTVEANMSRIYRKLGIRSRAELGAWLADRDHEQD